MTFANILFTSPSENTKEGKCKKRKKKKEQNPNKTSFLLFQ